MSTSIYVAVSIAYILLLFGIAFHGNKVFDKGKSIVTNPYIYALSLAVYCTAWTFYGSVGRASVSGIGFLAVYIGPVLFCPLWMIVLRKIILISKQQQITSIADFVSARYGKSSGLGILVTTMALFAVLPYISLQLKAISSSFAIIKSNYDIGDSHNGGFYQDSAFCITILLIVFIMFGVRHLESYQRHEGLVAAVAFESLVKLIAFLAIGIYVVYYMYDGFGDLFQKAANYEALKNLFSTETSHLTSWNWFWISMFSVVLLPRQFHIGVVENTETDYLYTAQWLFPLYLLLINIFVLPIAFAGKMNLSGTDSDFFVLTIPIQQGQNILALLVFVGGLSAASGMVIVETIALSIMVGNHIIMPILLNSKLIGQRNFDVHNYLIWVRRFSIIVILIVAYICFTIISNQFSLVSIGLVSFTGVAQFAPAVIGGIFWRRATKKGAFAGLLIGFFVWGISLAIPSLAEVGLFSKSLINDGYFGLSLLKPYALMGLQDSDHISHAASFSLTLNVMFYIVGSLLSKQSSLEYAQADVFVNIYKYRNAAENEVTRRQATMSELSTLAYRFLGNERAEIILNQYETDNNVQLSQLQVANAELISYVETHLGGAIGASSAKIIVSSIAQEDPISLDEMMRLLDQTKAAIQYGHDLETQSKELQFLTQQLQVANEQLKTLDGLKADFISTVSHELRTPITSIRAFSSIIQDYKSLDEHKKDEYLAIIVSECDRVTRLINQVLDLEKVQLEHQQQPMQPINLVSLVRNTCNTMEQLMLKNNILLDIEANPKSIWVLGHDDHIRQVILNILSNAIKFCDKDNGQIFIKIKKTTQWVQLSLEDNGIGIEEGKQAIIFEKFTQLNDNRHGKPAGSGLGLHISQQIIAQHNGKITVKSSIGHGATFNILLPIYSSKERQKISDHEKNTHR